MLGISLILKSFVCWALHIVQDRSCGEVTSVSISDESTSALEKCVVSCDKSVVVQYRATCNIFAQLLTTMSLLGGVDFGWYAYALLCVLVITIINKVSSFVIRACCWWADIEFGRLSMLCMCSHATPLVCDCSAIAL